MTYIKKAVISGILATISAASLFGCGSSDKSSVKDTAASFMEAVKTGDTDTINACSSSEVASGYFVNLFDSDYIKDYLTSSLGDIELDDASLVMMGRVSDEYASLMEEYEVTEVTVNNDNTATATVTMTTSFPIDVVSSPEVSESFNARLLDYQETNTEEIARITKEEGAEAATNKVNNDMVQIAMDVYENAITNSEPVTYKIALGLKKNEETGNWYVTSVQSHDSNLAGTGAPATDTDTSATEVSIDTDAAASEVSSASEEASK